MCDNTFYCNHLTGTAFPQSGLKAFWGEGEGEVCRLVSAASASSHQGDSNLSSFVAFLAADNLVRAWVLRGVEYRA